MQISISLLLGMVKQLSLNAVIFSEFILLVVGSNSYISKKSNNQQLIKKLFFVNPPLNKPEILIVSAISSVGIILLVVLATKPVIDDDSLWYHLPVMAHWYQEKSLDRLPTLVNSIVGYYPYNWEALCTLFVLPFQEDFLVTAPNLVAWLMFGFSTYLLSITLGAKRIYAIAASSLLISIPTTVQQVNTIHIDLPFAAFFTAGLYFGISYIRTRALSEIVLFLGSVGIILGIKTSGIGYGLLLITLLLTLLIVSLFKSKNYTSFVGNKHQLGIWIIFGISCLLWLGGFWYIKNLIDTGNPLGIIRIKLLNTTLFPGTMDLSRFSASSLASLFKIQNLSHWKILLNEAIVRLQIPFIAMVTPIIFFIIYLGKRRITIRFEYLFSLVLLIIVTASLYWNTPYSATTGYPYVKIIPQILGQGFRYGLPLLGALSIAAAVSATSLQLKEKTVLFIVLISSILGIVSSLVFDIVRVEGAFKSHAGGASAILHNFLNTFKSNPGEAIIYLINFLKDSVLILLISIGFYILVLWVTSRWNSSNFGKTKLINQFYNFFHLQHRWSVTAILVVVLIVTTFTIREIRDVQRVEIYGDVYEYLSTNQQGKNNINYLMSKYSYLFYGKNLENKVLSIKSQSDDISQWLKDLSQNNIEFVAIGSIESQLLPRELSWLQKPEGSFELLLGKDPKIETVLYRFKTSKQ